MKMQGSKKKIIFKSVSEILIALRDFLSRVKLMMVWKFHKQESSHRGYNKKIIATASQQLNWPCLVKAAPYHLNRHPG
jgi:hypothetical protein